LRHGGESGDDGRQPGRQQGGSWTDQIRQRADVESAEALQAEYSASSRERNSGTVISWSVHQLERRVGG
jgi:hypothetical protein